MIAKSKRHVHNDEHVFDLCVLSAPQAARSRFVRAQTQSDKVVDCMLCFASETTNTATDDNSIWFQHVTGVRALSCGNSQTP